MKVSEIGLKGPRSVEVSGVRMLTFAMFV